MLKKKKNHISWYSCCLSESRGLDEARHTSVAELRELLHLVGICCDSIGDRLKWQRWL